MLGMLSMDNQQSTTIRFWLTFILDADDDVVTIAVTVLLRCLMSSEPNRNKEFTLYLGSIYQCSRSAWAFNFTILNGEKVLNGYWSLNLNFMYKTRRLMYKTRCARITGAGWVRVTEPQPVPAPVCTRSCGLHGFTNPWHSLFALATKAVSLVSPACYVELACELHKLLQGITSGGELFTSALASHFHALVT